MIVFVCFSSLKRNLALVVFLFSIDITSLSSIFYFNCVALFFITNVVFCKKLVSHWNSFLQESAAKGDQPLFFGDSVRGQVLSVAFNVRDAQARGFHRQFSVCVLMRDALFLLQAWPFLTTHLRTITSQLQELAAKVAQ